MKTSTARWRVVLFKDEPTEAAITKHATAQLGSRCRLVGRATTLSAAVALLKDAQVDVVLVIETRDHTPSSSAAGDRCL